MEKQQGREKNTNTYIQSHGEKSHNGESNKSLSLPHGGEPRTKVETYLQNLPQSFASLGVEAVLTQIQRRDTRIHLPQNTAKKGKSSWHYSYHLPQKAKRKIPVRFRLTESHIFTSSLR
jgi:hypothetical protein